MSRKLCHTLVALFAFSAWSVSAYVPVLAESPQIVRALGTRSSSPPIVEAAQSSASYGAWEVVPFKDFVMSYTANGSGSVFGLICGKTCLFYVNFTKQCEQGHKYPAMVNSDPGSLAIELRCVIVDGRYLLMFDADLVSAFKAGGIIGFAIPLESGEFNVARFSLSGGAQAIYDTAQRASRLNKSGDQLRDFSL